MDIPGYYLLPLLFIVYYLLLSAGTYDREFM